MMLKESFTEAFHRRMFRAAAQLASLIGNSAAIQDSRTPEYHFSINDCRRNCPPYAVAATIGLYACRVTQR
jgi:hypothetical protein